jgi:Gpi18-like mannosyltransferase
VLVLAGGYIRYVLGSGITADYTDFFLPWHRTLVKEGFDAFSGNFANYTFPYLFLLWSTTLLSLPSLVAVKLVALVGDYFLAVAVFSLVSALRPSGWARWIAPAVVLLAPSVFLASAYWGQVDSLYTGFLLLALSAIVRGRHTLGWLFWGIAFAFKLQAVFFLPVLLVVLLGKSFRWFQPLVAFGVFVLCSAPPMLVGSTFEETFVYLNQTTNQWRTSYWSASVYEWVPDSLTPYVGGAGSALAFAVVLALCVFAASRLRLDRATLVDVALLALLVVPLLLPYMHDRYFYPGTVLAIVVAVLRPHLLWAAVVLQAVAVWSYMPFLTGDEPVPLVVAPALVLVTAYALGRGMLRRSHGPAPLAAAATASNPSAE